MRRHLIGEHNGRLGNSVRPTRICSRTRRGGIPQEGHPRARVHDLLIDARRRRSTSASTPTARKRNLRKTRNPSERAGQPTCLGACTRRRLTLSPSHCTAGELEQFNRRHQRPHQRSSLAASLHCPRKSPGQLLRYRQKQIFRGNHRHGQDLLFGLRVHSGTRRLRKV